MKILLFVLSFMHIITSCTTQTTTPVTNTPKVAETKLNVPYGKDSLQRMDLYLPANRSANATKSIILIHGGGWNSGSKSDFSYYIDTFKKRLPDYAIFNLDYRLVSKNHVFPTQEQDVKSAIDFIAAHAEEYGINKDKMVLLGASAGAHLALLQAYKNPSPKIKAVIDFFGPTDLLEMYQHPWHPMIPYLLQTLTKATPTSNIAIYKESSPVTYITASSPPTLILQGGSDAIVPASQSKILNERLEKAGVVHDMVIYPGERHGWHGANLTHSFDRIMEFLKVNVP